MNARAVAVRLQGWNVAQGVKWLRRALPAALTLSVAALLVQPPAQSATAAPAKADPVLYAKAAAHPPQSFPIIVREAAPATAAAEGLVKSLGGHITHELRLIGGFSAVVPGSAVGPLTSSVAVWRV